MKQPSKSKIGAVEELIAETVALCRRLRAVSNEAHGDSRISAGMRGVMSSLEAQGPQTVPQMARARPASRQHIQELVNRLLEPGLVELTENPAHKRSSFVHLTEQGRKELAAIRRRERALLAAMPLGIPKKELKAATETLRSLRAVFESPQRRRKTKDAQPV